MQSEISGEEERMIMIASGARQGVGGLRGREDNGFPVFVFNLRN